MTNDLTHDHEHHDASLAAAAAAGDLEGADRARAERQLAGCSQCRTLHDDLRSLRTALGELPRIPAPRDFTLTDVDVARIRRRGWRRLLATVRGDGFRLARPVGASLATLGFAGLVFGTIAGGAPLAGASATPEAGGDSPSVLQEAGAPRDTTTTSGDAGAGGAGPEVPAGVDPYVAVERVVDDDAPDASDPVSAAAAVDTNEAMIVLSGSLFIVGLGLFGLRWTADRLGDG